jgi:hypothetical protein
MEETTKKLIIFPEERPLSWSQISSFEYDPDKWYDRYMLRNKPPETGALTFGKQIGEMVEKDPNFLPELPRAKTMEYPMKVKFGEVWLIGYADSYEPGRLIEYKSGQKPWTQERVDEHGQLTLYCLMEYLINGIKPEEQVISLHWMPTKENGDFSVSFNGADFQHFKTSRSTRDILEFGMRITKVIKEMQEYVDKKTCLEAEPVLHSSSAINNN